MTVLGGLELGQGLLLVAAAVTAITLLVGYRAVAGPTVHDRVIALNVAGTNAVVVIALVAAGLDQESFLDIALVYALLNFLMSIAISKFTVERGGVL